MKTVTKHLYRFNELTGRPKEKAKETIQEWIDEDLSVNLPDVAQFHCEQMEKFGFDVTAHYSCSYSQGDGASFVGTVDLVQFALSQKAGNKIRSLIAWVAEYDTAAQISLNRYGGNYVHDGMMRIDARFIRNALVDTRQRGFDTDEQDVLFHAQLTETGEWALEFARDKAREMHKILCEEIEYYWEDKNFDNYAAERGFWFDENGRFEGMDE